MYAYDFTVVVPHSKGSLANLAEELGREQINIEGLCAVEHGACIEARSRIQGCAPYFAEALARRGIVKIRISRQTIGQQAHIRGSA